MSLATYLVQRGKRGIWQLRVPIPRALHAPGLPKERVKSMATSDRRIASDRALSVLAEWKNEWARAQGSAVVTRQAGASRQSFSIRALVAEAHERILAGLETQRRAAPVDDESQDTMLLAFAAELKRLTRRALDGDFSRWEPAANNIIAARGLPISKDSAEYDALVAGLADVTIDAMALQQRRHAGELDAQPRSEIVREQRQRREEVAEVGETLLELFDRYAERRLAEGAKRADVLKQDRKVIEQFSEFVGRSRRVDTITAVSVRAYRDTMFRLPTRWKDRKELAGLSMREAAAKAGAANLPRMSMVTINKYLSTISPVFAWLIQEKWNITNPCDGLFYQKVKGRNPRPPFSSAQLNVILRSPLFVGFAADGAEYKPGAKRADDWRYWLPLLAMFTGARVGELAQLHVNDVEQHETGVWFVTIRHDEARGQTTKSGHSRPAVIPSQLIGLGFLRFVERQRERSGTDGKPQLFPELEANDRNQIGARPSEFWRDYLKAIGVKSGRDGYGAHSFRHTMADRLRDEAGLLDDQIEVALGHNQKTVTSGYGRIRQGTVPLLSGMVEQVTFRGVDFSHLRLP